MTYFAGYWVSILFEVPLLGLEKFIFPNPKEHSTLKKRNQIIDSNKEIHPACGFVQFLFLFIFENG